MGVSFANEPGQAGFARPNRFNGEVYDCEVEGEIPSDLSGTFFRVGPNRAYPQLYPDDIPLNGDGMASLFRIADGACDYAQRYIKTQRYLAEAHARRALFGRYRNRGTSDPSVRSLSHGTANTHIVWHAGKLMTLKEDSPPVLVDPHTLETIDNYHTFDGQLTSRTFSAHPKLDPHTGEMIGYGYEAKGDCTTDVAVFSFDARGRKTWEAWIEAPYVSMMHDMAVTENYVVIPTTGYATSPERLESGLLHWAYDSSRPIHVAVIPRGGEAKDVRWFEGPHCCIVHTVGATEQGGRIVLDFQASDGNVFPFFASVDGAPFEPAKARSTIRRWTIDMNSGDSRVAEEMLLAGVHSALPRIDDRHIARPYVWGYSSEFDADAPLNAKGIGGRGAPNNALARWNIETRQIVKGFIGEGRSASEAVFAPRQKSGREGDGYLMAVADNYPEMTSELVIFDAERLEEGVIARVLLPFRAHAQVHGSWVPRWDLDFPDSMPETLT